ncbi:MAG: hypothetical protein EZS28_018226 [Streblomastix strix]|uniref:Uncharacterized protein n=1 Tax=Streblomastix strix TaxID=222440 RepID=A0A5J4VUU7_9EUKA|nr:MAG: hypothetical protein EZS28_018226 [Streblomastix strix]
MYEELLCISAYPGRFPIIGLRIQIKRFIEEDPYISLTRIADCLGYDEATIRRAIAWETDYHRVYLKQVPHTLDAAMKQKRVQGAKIILTVIRKQKQNRYKYLLTGDDSYVFYSYPQTKMFIKEGKEIPQVPRRRKHDLKIIKFHPTYSLDIAPSDYFLFGKLKTLLKGTNYSDKTELMAAVPTILSRISQAELYKANNS